MIAALIVAAVLVLVIAGRRGKRASADPPTAVRVLPDAGPRRPGYRFRGSGGSM